MRWLVNCGGNRADEKGERSNICARTSELPLQQEIDPGGSPQFGLVAEYVEKVSRDLVTRDADRKVYTVRCEAVNAMLLNESLKEHRKNEEQQATIAELKSSGIEQRDEIAALRAELKEQRALIQRVNDKVELNRPVPQTALNNQ
jgi:hypothetical protein